MNVDVLNETTSQEKEVTVARPAKNSNENDRLEKNETRHVASLDRATSLLVDMKNMGGLTVHTVVLESYLEIILNEIKYQATILSKISKLEDEQSEMRKEFNEFRIGDSSSSALDAINKSEKNGNGGRMSTYVENKKDVPFSQNLYQSNDDLIDEVYHTNSNGYMDELTIGEMNRNFRKDLIGLKTIIRQIQKNQDNEVASSLENDRKLSMLKMEVVKLHREVSSCLIGTQITKLKGSLDHQKKEIENYVNEILLNLRLEVDTEAKNNFSKLESWCSEHKLLSEKRQLKLEKVLSFCAKSCDLMALQDNVHIDSNEVWKKVKSMDWHMKQNQIAIKFMRESIAITTFRRNYLNMKRKLIAHGWLKWQNFIKKQNEASITSLKKLRLMKKVIKHQMGGLKRLGFIAWKDFVRCDRVSQGKRDKATQMVYRRMRNMLLRPRDSAFRRWHQITVMEKVDLFQMGDGSYYEEEIESDFTENFSIVKAITSFGRDINGAISFLARELDKIKTRDIRSLRRDWEIERDEVNQRYEKSMIDALHQMDRRTTAFEAKINESVQELCDEVSKLRSQVSSQERELNGTKKKVEKIETVHGKRIDILHEKNEKNEEEVLILRGELQRANEGIQCLFTELSKSRDHFQKLTQESIEISKNHDETKQELREAKLAIERNLDHSNKMINENRDHCDILNKQLDFTNNSLESFKNTTLSDLMEIRDILNAPGVQKPCLSLMVDHCITYEKIAKEKNYIVAINSVYDGTKEIDIPGDIAAFAFDYGAWIAYQADREVITKTIVGANPDEILYVDDEIESRRRTLLER